MEEDHHVAGCLCSSKETHFFVILTQTLICIGALSAVSFWAGWQVKSKETCPLTRVECGSSVDGFLSAFLWIFLDFFLYLWNCFFKAIISLSHDLEPSKPSIQNELSVTNQLYRLVLLLLALRNRLKNAHLTERFGGSALGCLFLLEVWIVLRTSSLWNLLS